MQLKLEVTLIQRSIMQLPDILHYRKTIDRNYMPTTNMFINLDPYVFQVHEIWDDNEYNTLRLKEIDKHDFNEDYENVRKQLKQSGFEEYDPSAHRFQTEEAGTDYRRT